MVGLIYKIKCEECDVVYVGKAERSLKTRFSKHRPPSFGQQGGGDRDGEGDDGEGGNGEGEMGRGRWGVGQQRGGDDNWGQQRGEGEEEG